MIRENGPQQRADLQETEGVLFLSYSTLDKNLAGRVRDSLSVFGFEVFLAHENLVPSEEWQQRIRSELSRCNVFMPLISENFRTSEWTDQEVGHAFSRIPGCLILSVLVPPISSPHGFLKILQALPLAPNVDQTCRRAVDIIDDKLGTGDARKTRVIEQFSGARSFDEARKTAQALLQFKKLSLEQMDTILTASITNDQILREAYVVRKTLGELVSRHRASPEMKERFLKTYHA